MTNFEPNDPATLALDDLILPNWTTPVTDYDGGIKVAAVEGGLRFVVDPWGTMNEGDKLEVFWGNDTAPVWNKTIELAEVNKRIPGVIDAQHIVRGDAFPVFYRVTRVGQGEEDSLPHKLLVKLDRPGGADQDLPTPGHSELKYSIPQEIIDNGVGPVEADAGVPITILPYPFMRRHDEVFVAWGSEKKSVKVTQAQVDDPTNNPLVVLIDKAMLERAGDGPGLAVAYQVVDEVGNYPDEDAPWSATTYILVDLGQNRLDAPLVLEADPVSNIIDLETLGEADVTVLVNTTGGAFLAGDTVSLTWHGTPAEGAPVIEGPIDAPVVRVGLQVSFTIPNAKVKAIAKGRATVSYLLKSPGLPDRPSKKASVSVEGQISDLAKPSVVQAPAGQLPADAPFATVLVPYYEGRVTGDLITLYWEGTRPGGGQTSWDLRIIVGNEPPGSPIERNVPASEIAPLDGGTVKVYYIVANDSFGLLSVRESLPLDLRVGEARPDMPEPEVPQADANFVLLPENVPNGADVIAPFTGTLAGDIVGLRWVGSNTGAHPLYEIPLNSHTAGYPVPFLVQPEHIGPNLNGTVQVDYYLKRGVQPARFSRMRELSIGHMQPPGIKEASGSSLDPIAARHTLTALVEYDGMASTDEISVTWTGTPGGGSHTTAPVPVGTVGTKEIALPTAVVAFNLGKPVEVTYSVTRNGSTRTSSPYPLTIQALAQTDLTTPRILQAANGGEGSELDLNNVSAGGTLRIDGWPHIAAGQYVWLHLVGTQVDGSAHNLTLWQAPTSVQQSDVDRGYLEGTVPYDYLKVLQHDSTLQLEFKVAFDQNPNEAQALAFPTRSYTVKVVALLTPSIYSVRDSQNVEVPHNGSTPSTTLTLTGTATADLQVEVFDHATSQGKVTVNSSGIWTLVVSNLGLGPHLYTAKAQYGTQPVSAARSLTVIARLTLDTTPLTLSGFHFRTEQTPPNPPAQAFAIRAASGGVPPYRYESSAPAVAAVDSAGKVVSLVSGSATITASDASGQSLSYPVTTSNVYILFGTGLWSMYPTCSSRAAEMGGRIPTLAEWRALMSNYNNAPGIHSRSWSSDDAGNGKRWTINPDTGATEALPGGNVGQASSGFGIKAV